MCVDKTTGKIKPKFSEMITTGRTGSMSATGFMGIISGILSLTVVFALVIFYFVNPGEAKNILEIIDRLIIIFSIAAGLLGVRKISGVIGNKQFSAGSSETITTERKYYSNDLNSANEAGVLNE